MKVWFRIILLLIVPILFLDPVYSQDLKDIKWNGSGIRVVAFQTSEGTIIPADDNLPLFTLHIRNKILSSAQGRLSTEGNSYKLIFTEGLTVKLTKDSTFNKGWSCTITFFNSSPDTIEVFNLVPFGESNNRVYITASGPNDNAR